MENNLVVNFEIQNNELDAEFDLGEIQNFDAEFVIYSEGTTWGNILGTITNQTDLINFINGSIQSESDTINARIDSEVERLEDEIADATLDIRGSDLIGVSQQEQTVTITSKTFVFEQGIPAKDWVVIHNLGKRPSITTTYTNGQQFEAYREYPDDNTVIIRNDNICSGYVYLN